jgi:hypothetical protein
MPQFDFYCFTTQAFWVLIFFFFIYFIIYFFFLIKSSESLKIRNKIFSSFKKNNIQKISYLFFEIFHNIVSGSK